MEEFESEPGGRPTAWGDHLQPQWDHSGTHGDSGADDRRRCADDDDELGDDADDEASVASYVGTIGLCEVTDAEVVDNAPVDRREAVEDLAEQLRAHAKDARLYEAVVSAGFRGPRWEELSSVLLKYGLAVVDGWLRTGYIFTKAAKQGRPVFPQHWELTQLQREQDLRLGLADEVVALTLIQFREMGVAGTGWRPDGGAGLGTFFVGGCVLAFNNVFNRWRRQERRWDMHRATAPSVLTDYHDGIVTAAVQRVPAMYAEPGQAAADGDYLHRVFNELNDVERVIVELTDEGYSQEEIGEMLDGLSARAVEGRLHRLRKKGIRSKVEGGGDD